MDVFRNGTVRTVINAKLHGLPSFQGRRIGINRCLVHQQLYSIITGDSAYSAVLVEARQYSLHIETPFPFRNDCQIDRKKEEKTEMR